MSDDAAFSSEVQAGAPPAPEPEAPTPEDMTQAGAMEPSAFVLPDGEALEVAPADPDMGQRAIRFFGGVALFLVVGCILAVMLQGYAADFMVAGLQILPFPILAALAHAGSRALWGVILSYLWMAIILTGIVGFVVGGSLFVFVASGAFGGRLSTLPPSVPTYGVGHLVGVILVALLGTVVTGALCFPAARLAVSRRLAIDPHSHVHAIGLATTAGISVLFLGQLAASAGHPIMLDTMHIVQTDELTPERMLFLMVFTLAWSVPGAIVAVGYPLTRNLKESLARLGFVRPTARQVVGGVLGAGALVLFMNFAVDPVITGVWKFFRWPPTDIEAFEKLLAPAMTPLGAVVIAITAGVGEEMAIRGVLQPRLGILLPNLFFTSLHAMQYGFDGLLSVFLVGMILGYIRMRTNTTTSAIVHGTYDFILVMASIYLKP